MVTRGRAGKHVAILDSSKKVEAVKRPERNETMRKNSLFFKLFARAAKDASPEELETMAADAAAALDEDPGKTEPAAPAAQDPAKEETRDTASLDSKLDMILELLGKKEETPGADTDPLDSLVKKLTGEEAEPDVPAAEAKVVPAEELDKSACAADRAVMRCV